jgi:hypothetical protein
LISPKHIRRYPHYLLQPYINVKEAVHHVLSEDWYHREEEAARVATMKDNGLSSQSALPCQRSPRKQTSTATSYRLSAADKKGRKSPGFYKTLEGQVKALGLGAFEGRAHSGIDVRAMDAQCWLAVVR